jgi:hypothetical protein
MKLSSEMWLRAQHLVHGTKKNIGRGSDPKDLTAGVVVQLSAGGTALLTGLPVTHGTLLVSRLPEVSTALPLSSGEGAPARLHGRKVGREQGVKKGRTGDKRAQVAVC